MPKQIKRRLDRERDIMLEQCPFCKQVFRDPEYAGDGISFSKAAGTAVDVREHILQKHHMTRIRVGNKYRWVAAEAED